MKKKVLRILLTLLIIAWMGLIFFFSSQTGPASASSSHSVLYLLGHISKSLTGHDLVAALSPAAFGFLEFIIRKCAHMFAYFILSILTMSLLFTYKKYPIRFKACISLLISFQMNFISSLQEGAVQVLKMFSQIPQVHVLEYFLQLSFIS